MGIYSTLTISRSRALQFWKEKQNNPELSNKELEEFIEPYLEKRLYNCIVIDDDYYKSGEDHDDHVL